MDRRRHEEEDEERQEESGGRRKTSWKGPRGGEGIFCCFLGLVLGWEFSWRDDAINFSISQHYVNWWCEATKVEGGASAETCLLLRVTCAFSAIFCPPLPFALCYSCNPAPLPSLFRGFFFWTKVKAAAAHLICLRNCFGKCVTRRLQSQFCKKLCQICKEKPKKVHGSTHRVRKWLWLLKAFSRGAIS